ncbi:MAG: precorrin-3B C(17)-methyltransferase [Archaeoglobaceae archaeon]|nr:precorrin-3B C(17)-methyltransferase [Archaeoglobaceae archaeon]MDW8128157.1 precorrin-3B C(17)-methyltransferase [Archaeoglobaceae archaeon]
MLRLQLRGKLYVVGIGPGSKDLLTLKAYEVIRNADVVIGHKRYIELIRDLVQGEIIESAMRKELERVKKAVELAKEKKVCLVSGGDPCIYGIASLLEEYIASNEIQVDYELIPGITALNAANSLLGCAVSGDHGVLSLSDQLVDWGKIEHRLRVMLRSDVPIAIYNPSSRKRVENLKKALEIIFSERGDVKIAIVKNAYREGEEVRIKKLSEINIEEVDMSSILIISSSETLVTEKKMLTPRGYSMKYEVGAKTKRAKEIAEQSAEILREAIPGDTLRDEIVRRAVMATGDMSYRDLLVFKGDPEQAVEALRRGAKIIVDVEMVRIGLRANAISAISFAKGSEKTRTAEGILNLAEEIEGAVVGIGNAPSSAMALCEVAENYKPAFIVATPVGFVGASESKEMVRKLDIPSITNVGTKGGSGVCTAILNCLIEHAGSH